MLWFGTNYIDCCTFLNQKQPCVYACVYDVSLKALLIVKKSVEPANDI